VVAALGPEATDMSAHLDHPVTISVDDAPAG
jgi:hypothetical protein